MLSEVASPLGRTTAVLTLEGVVRHMGQQMGTHRPVVLGEMLAGLPPAQKRRRANRPFAVLLKKMLIQKLGLGEGGIRATADPLAAVLLAGGRGSLTGHLGKRIFLGVHREGNTADSRLRVRRTGGLRHDKCLSQINEISQHTLEVSRVWTAVSCLDEVGVESYNNISRLPQCRSTMPTSELLMAVSPVTEHCCGQSVSR
jgi:hypothetical protein